MADIPHVSFDPDRSEVTFWRTVECTCGHPADDHDFDIGCTQLGDDGWECTCEWWDE